MAGVSTTVGQVLINSALPSKFRSWNHLLDAKGLEGLMQRVATEDPEAYRDTVQRLLHVGGDVAFAGGSFSFNPRAFAPAKAALESRQKLRGQIQQILESETDPKQRRLKILTVLDEAREPLEKAILQEAVDAKNPFAFQILSKSRGNPGNLRSLIGQDLMSVDQSGRPIPVAILKSQSEGLDPAEFWAGTYGARAGVIATKLSTADSGFFNKQLAQVMHRLQVTAVDEDDEDGGPQRDPDDHEPPPVRGLPVDTADTDNVGALLARQTGDYPRNTVLTPRVLKDLSAAGIGRILVRSPISGGPRQGGVYARDVGMREYNRLAQVGEMVGSSAAGALGEAPAQGALSSKHAGGVAGASAGRAVSGFTTINNQIQIPKTFQGGATHAGVDGKVSAIREEPQGGHSILIGTQAHYVPQGVEIKVQPGDEVEAGDMLTAGQPNPRELVAHKGIGEGRRYFLQSFGDAFRSAGLPFYRRNAELLARGLIDHVTLDQELGDYVPGDVLPYSTVEASWKPRPDTRQLNVTSAAGKYLERPVLHFTVGTKLRPSVIRQLQEFQIDKVHAHNDPPPFRPTMIRAMDSLRYDPDPLTRFLGSNLQRSLQNSAHRGAVSDPQGTSYVPALAQGVNFEKFDKSRASQPITL